MFHPYCMETKKITKTDGKRMFVELSKEMITPKSGLPPLQKGDEVLIIPQRKFTDEFLIKMIGKKMKCVLLFELFGSISYSKYEGIVVEYKEDFWPKHDSTGFDEEDYLNFCKEKGIEPYGENNCKTFTLLKYGPSTPNGEPILNFSAKKLSSYCNVQFMEPPKPRKDRWTKCSNQKCKLDISIYHKFCPGCGRKNKFYQKSPTPGGVKK
jgi:hypothetical protein